MGSGFRGQPHRGLDGEMGPRLVLERGQTGSDFRGHNLSSVNGLLSHVRLGAGNHVIRATITTM